MAKGSRGGKVGAGGAGSGEQSLRKTSNISAEELTTLNGLGTDSRMSEIKSVLETLYVGASFYNVSERGGELLSSTLYVKTGDDTFTANGAERSISEVARNIRDRGGTRQAEKPDTSSHVKITGTRAQTVDGLKFKDGTYDVNKNMNSYGKGRGVKSRKIEQAGKITTYDGVQYGVARSGGEYFTTHIPTGMLIGRGQKSMSDVAAQIKDVHEKYVKLRTDDLRKSAEKFKNTLRGD